MATGKGVRRSRVTTLARRSTASSASITTLIRASALPCLTPSLRGSNSDQVHPSLLLTKRSGPIVAFVPFSGGFHGLRLLVGYIASSQVRGAAHRRSSRVNRDDRALRLARA